jgi:hypothetical protein
MPGLQNRVGARFARRNQPVPGFAQQLGGFAQVARIDEQVDVDRRLQCRVAIGQCDER